MVSWEEASRRAEDARRQPRGVSDAEIARREHEELVKKRDAIVAVIHEDVVKLFKDMLNAGLRRLFKRQGKSHMWHHPDPAYQWKDKTVFGARAEGFSLTLQAGGSWTIVREGNSSFEFGRRPASGRDKPIDGVYTKNSWDGGCYDEIINNAEQLKDIARVLVAMIYIANGLAVPKSK